MAKQSIPRKSTTDSRHPSPDTRTPEQLHARRAEMGMPRPCPEGVANATGYLSQRLWGLSELLRAASHEGPVGQEAVFFATDAMDDIAWRLDLPSHMAPAKAKR